MCTPGTHSAVPLHLDPAGAHTWQRDAQEPVTTTFRRSPLKLSRYELEGAIHLRNPLEQDLSPSRHSLGHAVSQHDPDTMQMCWEIEVLSARVPSWWVATAEAATSARFAISRGNLFDLWWMSAPAWMHCVLGVLID